MIHWLDHKKSGKLSEKSFVIESGSSSLPGVFWQGSSPSEKSPLVLLAHGGSGHKRSEKMVAMGTWISEGFGWNAVSIDGPAHGDRGPVQNSTDPAYREMWQRPDVVGTMVEDWKCVINAFVELDSTDPERIGFWSLSMGTMFGIPYVASDSRIKAAVLGKSGLTGSSVERSGIRPYFEESAPQIMQPVLFSIQWDDERFDRQGQLELFDLIGSSDKRLHAYPGRHQDSGPEALQVQAEFLKRYLE